MDPMDARSNDESRSGNRVAAPLSFSLSPDAKAVISRGVSIPVAFMIYRCSRLSFAVSYASLSRYILWRECFYCFIPSRAGRGMPSDVSITGSELHPGSYEQDLPPYPARKGEGQRKRLREIPRGYPSDTLSAEVALHRGGLKTDGQTI